MTTPPESGRTNAGTAHTLGRSFAAQATNYPKKNIGMKVTAILYGSETLQ